ncbi:MAG: hypothetical protein ABEJ31_13410 [Haloarculaceae archaeon]
MPTDEIDADVAAVTDRLRDDEDRRLIEVEALPDAPAFALTERPLTAALSLAADLGAAECYLLADDDADGDLGRAALAFFHRGHLHVAERTTDDWDAATADDERDDADADDTPTPVEGTDGPRTNGDGPAPTGGESGRPAAEAVDAEQDRKRELAAELVEHYEEFLDEGDRYRLEYCLESLSVPQLRRMLEQAERCARADPEEEERLARIVYRDGRFNPEYTASDTEMLLNALNVAVDHDRVRIQQVHDTAMSLLQVDR